MAAATYLRIQSQRCFRLAGGAAGPRLADELEALGRALEQEAREMEDVEPRRYPQLNFGALPAAAAVDDADQ